MGASLCEKCKYLELDDASLGGFDGASSTAGRSFLAFDEGDGARNIPLDYRFEDWLPNLPGLAESGRQGCGFCRLLRQSLLHSGVAAKTSDAARVNISMAYVWKTLDVEGFRVNFHGYPDRGLVALVVQIEFLPVDSTADQQPLSVSKISFDVDSEPGTFLNSVSSFRSTRG